MSGFLDLAGGALLLAGAAFLALGGLGLLRMPDIYNRIQAGTKATTLGTLLTMAGAALIMPGWAPRLALIVLFMMFTSPLSSHVLARAAHRSGIAPARTRTDRLAEDRADEPGSAEHGGEAA